MRNIQWIGGEYPQTILMNGGGLELSAADYEKQFNKQIDVSIELEEKVDGLEKAKEIKATPISYQASSSSSNDQLPAPWQSKNIGAAPASGEVQFRGGKFFISGSGSDAIGKQQDSFNYVYREFEGDGSIIVKVNSVSGQSRVHFDFYGLMFRASLDDDAPMFSFAHTLFRTCAFYRQNKGQRGIGNHENGNNQVPIWLKIDRSGDDFTASFSLDKRSWTKQYSANVNLPKKLYIGMFSTSSKDENAAGAEFSDFEINGTPSIDKNKDAPGDSKTNEQSLPISKPRKTKKEIISI